MQDAAGEGQAMGWSCRVSCVGKSGEMGVGARQWVGVSGEGRDKKGPA